MTKLCTISISIFLGILFLPGILYGQSNPVQDPPSIQVSAGKKTVTLGLTEADINVSIHGFVAETTMTLTFYNPHNQVLEGDFTFPLPEGSFISGYALDVNGKMVDGVVVEKKKGRAVFEKIVRQGIDPGLVEYVGGNNFRTRIFPFNPKSSRIVSVRYISRVYDRLYYLPLNFKKKLKRFFLRMEVFKTTENPVIKPGIKRGAPAGFQFRRWQDVFLAQTERNQYLPPEDLLVELPAPGGQSTRPLYLETARDGHTYFCLEDSGFENEDRQSVKAAENIFNPGYVTVLWDTSGSRSAAGLKKEIKLLAAYLEKLEKGDKQVNVDLVFFHYRRETAQRFVLNKTTPGAIDAILGEIQSAVYDGGTGLSSIKPPAGEPVPDIYLLFSDGIDNFGETRLDTLRFDAPLYAFSSSNRSHHHILRYLARSSGGMYFQLNTASPKNVIRSIGASPLLLMSITATRGSISEPYPAPPYPVNGPITVSGKLNSDDAVIRLAFGKNGTVTRHVTFHAQKKNAIPGNRLRIFWAQEKINRLQVFPKRNDNEIVSTGKTYGLVTPGTSLIVLERFEQYQEHEIMPPETLPGMRKKYIEELKRRNKKSRKTEKDNIKRVIKMWKSKVKWWRKKHPKTPPPLPPIKNTSTHRLSASGQRLLNRYNLDYHTARQGIGGIVIDLDEVRLPGITVILKGPALPLPQLTTVTNERGQYFFPDIPAGTYQITGMLEGMNTYVRRGIALRNGEKVNVSFAMVLRNIEESVVVSGRAPTLDRQRSSGRRTFNLNSSPPPPSRRLPRASRESFNAAPSTKTADVSDINRNASKIAIKAWEPNAPYMETLKKANKNAAYSIYLRNKKKYRRSPSFYLDCSDVFASNGQNETAIRILSNIAELEMENASMLRLLGQRLVELKYLELAELFFRKVLELRPEEPQSYRDLALVLQQRKKYREAAKILYHIISHSWDQRFQEIEAIALMELNNTLRLAEENNTSGIAKNLDIDSRLITLLDADIRVVLTWDADLTDMDLWIIDPFNEKTFYSHNRSSTGGYISPDFTQGYGPEEFFIKKACRGKYEIKVNYFGSTAVKLLGPITVRVDIFTGYGRPGQTRKTITRRLTDKKEVLDLGEIEFGEVNGEESNGDR